MNAFAWKKSPFTDTDFPSSDSAPPLRRIATSPLMPNWKQKIKSKQNQQQNQQQTKQQTKPNQTKPSKKKAIGSKVFRR